MQNGKDTKMDFGTLTDYITGQPVRPATAAEWREGAEKVNSGKSDASTGRFTLNGYPVRDVYVDGGPDPWVSVADICGLKQEAAAAGDHKMAGIAGEALEALGGGTARQPGAALAECVRVILDHRMEG